nr:porin family protein [Flavihumibacter sp. CACIAM 22H1]
MRKASAILVAFLLSCSALFAQYEKGKPSIGIKTGLNISTFRTPLSYSDFNPSWDKAGFVAGAFVELPLNKRFSIQPEFLYSAMGSNVETDKGDTRYRFNYFSIPLVVKFKFAKSLESARRRARRCAVPRTRTHGLYRRNRYRYRPHPRF